MIKKKSTDELNRLLSHTPIKQYLNENDASFNKKTLPQMLEAVLKSNGISQVNAIKAANLERTFGYQIFKGIKKPSRDTLLRICIGMKASTAQTRALLLKIKAAPLYSKDKRDSVILFGILHHLNLQEIDELLYNNKLPVLSKI
ncbi:MAG: hypothetical protein IJ192_02705 [Clostridia bacterium]|nr:hypothetical protein [Clostridia bacterium]